MIVFIVFPKRLTVVIVQFSQMDAFIIVRINRPDTVKRSWIFFKGEFCQIPIVIQFTFTELCLILVILMDILNIRQDISIAVTRYGIASAFVAVMGNL